MIMHACSKTHYSERTDNEAHTWRLVLPVYGQSMKCSSTAVCLWWIYMYYHK